MTGRWQLYTAAAVGLVAAVFMYRYAGERGVPTIFYKLTSPGISDLEIYGGAVAVLRTDTDAAAAEVAVEIRDRGIGDARAVGDTIELSVPGERRRAAQVVAETLAGGGDVGFHWVVSNHPAMGELAGADLPALVGAESDGWVSEADGRRWSDIYLRGPRDTLERVVDAVDFGAGNRIALEQLPDLRALRDDPREWRTYVIEREPFLDRRDIGSARVGFNPTNNQPEVLVEFTRGGAEIFARETGANIGRKLAIVHAGDVAAAPTVQAEISGGRASITLGGDSPPLAAAETLTALLRGGPLSRPLELVDIREVEPAPLGPGVWARPLFAAAVGLALFALVWLIIRFAPIDEEAGEPAGRSPWLRALVTTAGLGLVYIARDIPIPGLGRDFEGQLGETAGSSLSIVGLGLTPVIAAFIAVEVVALAVPALRSWRHQPGGRARLTAVVGALAALLAVAEAVFMRRWLVAIDWAQMAAPGLGATLLTVGTLAAGVMFLVVVAGTISRHGLGNGYAVLIAGAAIAELSSAYRLIVGGVGAGSPFSWPMPMQVKPYAGEVAIYAVAMIAAIAATAWSFGRSRGGVPRPTAGIVPVLTPPIFAALGAALILVAAGPSLFSYASELSLATTSYPLVHLVAIAIVAVALSLAFAREVGPSSARALPSAGERVDRRREMIRAIAAGVAFCLIVAGLDLAINRYAGPLYLGGTVIAVIATAVVMDLVAEWRFRRRHGAVAAAWSVQRIAAADLAVAELSRAEIAALARTRRFRALFHFFAPFAPIEILVPAADGERARESLATLLAGVQSSGR